MSAGFQVYIWHFKDSDLVGISFLDMHFYIHNMVSLRSLALAADVYKSVSLLRSAPFSPIPLPFFITFPFPGYQEYAKALSIASRDARTTPFQAWRRWQPRPRDMVKRRCWECRRSPWASATWWTTGTWGS